MTFKLLVLRFMALVLRAQWLGDWSVVEMRKLHDDIEIITASEGWPVGD